MAHRASAEFKRAMAELILHLKRDEQFRLDWISKIERAILTCYRAHTVGDKRLNLTNIQMICHDASRMFINELTGEEDG